MRDLVAGLVALLLLMVALSLATALAAYRRRRQRARDSERALGRTVIAELPLSDDLVLVSEDDRRFYYGDRAIDKDLIAAVRLLVNGSPIAMHVSRRNQAPAERRIHSLPADAPDAVETGPEGFLRDRWDVEVEALSGTTLIQCGAIRDRVSQELARTIFDAIKKAIERFEP
jgi:hypothetical protein